MAYPGTGIAQSRTGQPAGAREGGGAQHDTIVAGLLAGRGVAVHAVLTGPTDTDMTQGFEIPKASPESVARAIFDGIENGEEDIFPDPMSQSIAAGWRGGVAKALEREQAPFRRCRVSGRYRRSRRPLLSTSTSGVRGALPRTPGPRSAGSRPSGRYGDGFVCRGG